MPSEREASRDRATPRKRGGKGPPHEQISLPSGTPEFSAVLGTSGIAGSNLASLKHESGLPVGAGVQGPTDVSGVQRHDKHLGLGAGQILPRVSQIGSATCPRRPASDDDAPPDDHGGGPGPLPGGRPPD